MSRSTKIVLGSLGGTMLLCIVLAVAFPLFAEWQNRRRLADMYIKDPAIIAQMANDMADYDLPPNYREGLVQKLLTTNALYIVVDEDIPDRNGYPIITLVQFPPEKYPNALAAREKMRQAGPKVETEFGIAEVTGQMTIPIRNQEVGLTVYKWVDDDGEERRSMISDVFKGKNGFLQLAIEGPTQGWNQEMIDAFIASLR